MVGVPRVTLFSVDLHAQEVVRWGDSPTPAAPEGFQVTGFTWEESTLLTGASTFQLGMDEGGIRVPEIDPLLDLALLRQPLSYSKYDAVFDGDPETTWHDLGFTCAELTAAGPWGSCDGIYFHLATSEVDLGARYPVDRVVIMSGLNDPGLTLRDFSIHFSPELPSSERLRCCPVSAPVLRPLATEVRDNREQVCEVHLPGLQPVRFMQIAVGEHEGGWEIHDIQVFGRGFVESATYVSNIIEFDRPVAWGQLRWAGFQGEGARVKVQTRTGSDPDPEVFWRFTGRGSDRVKVTREEYEDLGLGELAGTTYNHSHWSFWSAPYDFADSTGTQVVSPTPKRYFQFKVDFLSGEEGAELRHLELEAWPPVATSLVGEIWPVDSSVGEWREYTYSLRPTIVFADAGFDRLEIRSSALLGDVRDVRVGDAAVPWEQEAAEPHRLVVRLPHLQPSDSGVLVQVDFDAQVLRYGSTFDGTVWISGRVPLTPQRVNPGDATGEFEGNRVSVATSVRDEELLRVAIQPSVLTPNGDGVNDTALLTYEIFEVIGEPTVSVGIFDLGGSRVRRIQEGQNGIGRHERRFDGRDDEGGLLPPGIYLARVELATDEGSAVSIGVIHLAY